MTWSRLGFSVSLSLLLWALLALALDFAGFFDGSRHLRRLLRGVREEMLMVTVGVSGANADLVGTLLVRSV